MRPIAECHAIGNEIVFKPRHAADERVCADAGVLNDGSSAPQDRVIADGRMPRDHDVV